MSNTTIMTYSIPVDFTFSTSPRTLSAKQRANIVLPEKTILRVFGTVGSGKGTVSKMLSNFFAINTADTGKIWRAVTYGYFQEELENSKENTDLIFTHIQAKDTKNGFDLYYKGQLLDNSELRNSHIDARVSEFAVHREAYNSFVSQFLMGSKHSLILDGRGGKTTYLTDAINSGYRVIKIFLFVGLDQAAHRRALDYKIKDPSLSFSELLEDTKNKIMKRDREDYNHIIDQNMGWVDNDTFALDTTKMTIEEVFETLLWFIASDLEQI